MIQALLLAPRTQWVSLLTKCFMTFYDTLLCGSQPIGLGSESQTSKVLLHSFPPSGPSARELVTFLTHTNLPCGIHANKKGLLLYIGSRL